MTGMTIHTARESTIHIVGIRNVRLTTNIGPPGTRATELVSMVVALEGSPFLGGTSESKSCTARVSTFVCVGFTVSAQADAGPNPNTAIHNFDRWDYWSGNPLRPVRVSFFDVGKISGSGIIGRILAGLDEAEVAAG